MRISDWSSDVCSSDLDVADRCSRPDSGRAPVHVWLRTVHAVRHLRDGASFRRAASGGVGRSGLSYRRLCVPARLFLSRRPDGGGFPDGIALASFVESARCKGDNRKSEEHTSELQSLMRISYAVFCLKNQIHLYIQ